MQLAANSQHGIFHGIDIYTNINSIENTELFRLIYDRVGVTGTDWHWLALATEKGVTGSQSACPDLLGTVLRNESALE